MWYGMRHTIAHLILGHVPELQVTSLLQPRALCYDQDDCSNEMNVIKTGVRSLTLGGAEVKRNRKVRKEEQQRSERFDLVSAAAPHLSHAVPVSPEMPHVAILSPRRLLESHLFHTLLTRT